MGRAKVWRRPVTRMTSMPWACARLRVVRSVSEIRNSGLSRVPSISMAMRRSESAGTDNFNIRQFRWSAGRPRPATMLLDGQGRPSLHFLLKVCCPYATIMPDGDYRDEIKIPCVVPDAFPCIPSRSVRTRNRQAFRGRILLQSQVGTCRRVPAAVQEKPLSTAEEAGGDGPHAQGLDGPAALPYDRRRTLGLSRDHRVQELDGSE